MGTVTVPAEFFRGELRVYGDWREAFARELLQNATDAAPSRIDITLEDVDGHGRVTFTDDGHGMSRDVLENVFFALGKTTKTGPGDIGGFGRARIIICFAQTRYTLRTGHLLVEGCGGEYSITEVAEYQKGCKFVIDLLDDDCSRIRNAFRNLLEKCTLKIPVRIDGQLASGHHMPARATRIMRDKSQAPWAKAYVTPGWGQLMVRVHGLVMFTKWLSGNDSVILELEPARSREVLSASRDTLHTVYGDQLDHFISDLTRNRKAALRPAAEPLDLRVGGGGFMATDAYTTNEVEVSEQTGGHANESGTERGDRGGLRVALQPGNAAAVENAVAAYARPRNVGMLDLEMPEVPRGAKPVGFDVYLMADANDARVRKLARSWDPSTWDTTTGKRRRALLLAWKAAVGHAMDVLIKQRPSLGRVMWTVGWTFDTDVEAVHRSAGDGHILALNPVTATGTTAYQLSRRASRQKLLAIALHEVAHVVVDGHDEAFAGLLTDLFAAVDMAAADRVIREAASA
jgi:hypothetical protein